METMQMSPLDSTNHALHLLTLARPHLAAALDRLTLAGDAPEGLTDALKDAMDDLDAHEEKLTALWDAHLGL